MISRQLLSSLRKRLDDGSGELGLVIAQDGSIGQALLDAAEYALELREKLTAIAYESAGFDREDWNAYDAFGGNMDDAYDGGVNDGRIELARELVSK